MKPRSLQLLPRTLVVCFAPLLVCASANAGVVSTNESNGSGAWTLPSGTNLLAGRAPAGAAATHEGSSTAWSTVVDGTLGDVGGTPATSVTPNNGNTVTFALDTVAQPAGYNVTSFDSYSTWGNSGRDNQNYMLQYSTVGAPGTFITISTVSLQTARDRSTHTQLTDTAGFLAMGVHSIRLIFDRQENGYVGYREFVLRDTPTVVTVDNRIRDNDNNWPPFTGPNLLNGATATPPTVATHEGSSTSWTKLTDGALGTTVSDNTGIGQSVTPNNNDTVTFPLDLVAKPAGYDITSFECYAAWGSNGRDDQRYTLEYSVVGAPTTFLPITDVNNRTEYAGDYVTSKRATRSRVTNNTGAPLALGVAAIRVKFRDQENGYTGFREMILRDTPLPSSYVKESNNTHIWTLPAGTNLLANALPKNPTAAAGYAHGATDITSPDWTVLTDGSVGSAGTQNQSVGPNNGTFVEFPLDTSTNTKGYTLTSLDAYAAWGDSGRDDQNFTVSYAKVDDPLTAGVDESLTFIPIETVNNQTLPTDNSTHTRIAANPGFLLATNVGKVRFDFANQENSWVGYREFIALGSAVPLFSPLTWSGSTSSTWNTTDDNWKDSGVSSPFNSLAPLTFDTSGTNTSINIPVAITAASLIFSNDNTVPYTFTGDLLTVSNGVTLAGSGSATFGNSLQAAGVSVTGTGALTLSIDNTLTGNAAVSDGSLTVASNGALGAAGLTLTGGIANFTSAQPILTCLSGTAGAVFLGNSASPSNTELFVGNATSSTYGGTISDASVSAIGSLVKAGTSTLTLTGTNSYTGTTTVNAGELKLGKRLSLYNGNTANWTNTNILVSGASILSLKMGGSGEFTSSDVAAINTGGFDIGAVLGLDTSSGDAEISDVISSSAPLQKQGVNSLILSGNNSFTSGITLTQGNLVGANPTGPSFPSDVTIGNVTYHVFANMAFDNQFGPNSVLRFNNGNGALNAKVQLRGTSQTVAGLESGSNNRLAMIQNDEVGSPGYTTDPGPATLTIDTAVDYSFKGFIRNQSGGSVSLVKKGVGTQEFVNSSSVTSYSYNGATTIEAGKLRINFVRANSGFSSNVTILDPGTLNLHSGTDGYDFNPIVSGEGDLLVTGGLPVALTNGSNSWTGGTTVDGGFLALKATNANGTGDGPGQTCVGGAMTPTNVINLINGGILSLDNAGALGNSPVQPQYAPSIYVNEGSKIYGGTNTIAFVSNITLDGGNIEATNGASVAGFNTNLCLVGTVIVGGVSTVPSTIFTNAAFLPGGATPSANANVSLGSLGTGQQGTIFQVADVAVGADLTVSSILTNINASVSTLTKTGPGTMALSGANTYPGDTTVEAGELTVSGNSIVDTNKLALNGGKLGVTLNEIVGTLFYGGVQQLAGTYGSTSSGATYQDDSRYSGAGVLIVDVGPVTDPYILWTAQITDGDSSRTGDPDGDGFSNLQEFLFGTSPIASNGSLSTVEDTGSGLIVRWNQRATGSGVYVLQESATLENPWPTSSATITDNPTQDIPDYIRKQAAIPIDSAKKFVRVFATE